MAKTKFTHIMSINLAIESDSEERPSKSQIEEALKKVRDEDPDFEHVEWVDTEEN